MKYDHLDLVRYEGWTDHLPKREESTPYHSGAHSIRNFENAFAIAGLDKSKLFSVLEIGFCLGHSAEIMLQLGAAFVASVENSYRDQTIQAATAMGVRWKTMHELVRPDRIDVLRGVPFKFGFIDGDHTEEAILRDTETMKSFGIEWVLYDDFFKRWGDTQDVFRKQGICPVAILGTMALCHFPV